MFFSTLPNEYEEILNEEIWGCIKYIRMSYHDVMNMPIHLRKDIINRHNIVTEEENRRYDNNDKNSHIEGEALNRYAQLEQTKKKNEI